MTNTEQRPLSNRDEFATELSRLREASGLSVRDLASAVQTPLATIGGYLSGRHLPTTAQTPLLRRILAVMGVTDEADVQRWLDAAITLRRSPAARRNPEAVPYRGLFSYRREDADWFFGREDLAKRLVEQARAGGLCIVVGASGAGKSSLLQAGLLADWPSADAALITPGTEPNAALDTVFGPDGEAPGLVVIDQFEEILTVVDSDAERTRFLDRVAALASEPGSRAVVLGLRADFYAAATRVPMLLPALQTGQIVVGAMDENQLERAILGPAQRAGLTVDPDLVRTMTGDLNPRGAVQGPEVGALPLLSHVLREVCLRARRGRLTVADYHATGGIAGAVQQTAERVFNSLTPDEQDTARRLILRMVNLDEDSVVTRRSATISDPAMMSVLAQFVDERLITADEHAVGISHEALLTAWPRLHDWVAQDRAGLTNLRNLRNQAALWVDGQEDASALLRGGRLAAVQQWLGQSERSSDLDSREQAFVAASEAASAAERRRKRRQVRTLRSLVAIAGALILVAGGLAIYSSVAGARARDARNSAQATGDRALSRQLAVNAQTLRTTDPNVAAQLALVAYRTSPTAEARSALLDSTATDIPTRIAGHNGPTFAVLSRGGTLLAVSDDSDGSIGLYNVATPHQPRLVGVAHPATKVEQFAAAITPDGRHLLAGSSDGTISSWDISDPAHPGAPTVVPAFKATGVNSLALSADGRTLVAAGTTATLPVFDVSNGRLTAETPLTMPSKTDLATTVAYASDGHHVVAGGSGELSMWTVAGSSLIGQASPTAFPDPDDTSINTVAFSPDGRTLAVGSHSGQVTIYRVVDDGNPTKLTTALTKFGSWVNALTFSADGSMLAAGSSDSSAAVWTTRDWAPVTTMALPSLVTGVQFAYGTNYLITASTDGGARIWDVPGPQLAHQVGGVYAINWYPDSTHLLAGTDSATTGASLWNVNDPDHPRLEKTAGRTSPTVPELSGGVALSPDTHTAALTEMKGSVQLWNMAASQPVMIGSPLADAKQQLESLAWSPTGKLLAGGGNDGRIYLWDTSNPAATKLASPPIQEPNQVYMVSFSPDGKMLAAAVIDHTVRLWNVADPAHPKLVSTLRGFSYYVYAASFSRSGTLLAASSPDRTTLLWDISDPAHPQQLGGPLVGPTNQLFDVEFSPDGTKLIAASLDKSLWIWDIGNPRTPTPWAELTGGGGQMFVGNFSPNGKLIAGGTSADAVTLWSATPDLATSKICSLVGAPLTEAQWKIYLPEQAYRPPCPAT